MDEASKADGWTERRLTIHNGSKKLSMVFTEPLGEDFWLLPDDVVELRASFDDVTAGFEIDILAHGLVVYPSKGMGLFSAWQNGTELEVGHLRPDAWPSDE